MFKHHPEMGYHLNYLLRVADGYEQNFLKGASKFYSKLRITTLNVVKRIE